MSGSLRPDKAELLAAIQEWVHRAKEYAVAANEGEHDEYELRQFHAALEQAEQKCLSAVERLYKI